MKNLYTSQKTPKDLMEVLKQKAEENTLFYMVCKKFASRIRNRNYVTAAALKLAMNKDGLVFPLENYYEILEFLGKQGLGKIVLNPNGKVIGLTKIPVSLQSIGQIVVASKKVEMPSKPEAKAPELVAKAETPDTLETPVLKYATQLTVIIKGNPVVFPGPDTDPEQLGNLLINFSNMVKAQK